MDILIYTSRLLEGSNGTVTAEPDGKQAYIGIIIYIIGAFLMALGVNLQKYSINCEGKRCPDPEMQRSLWCQPIWVTGVISYGASGGLLSAALAFAPQSQLAPLMSVVIVSNALLARFFLYEPVTRRDLLSIIIIIVAVVMTTIVAPNSPEEHTTETLIALFSEPLFVVYICLLIAAMVTLWLVNRYLGEKIKHENNVSGSHSKTKEQVYAFTFGASAGCWGGLSVTLMKSAITILLSETESGGVEDFFSAWLFYPILAVLIVCWVMQLTWINKGLINYPAVFIVSIEAVLNEIVGVCGGILYFQEYMYFTVIEGIIFGFGLCMGIFGIVLFATRDNDVTAQDDIFCCNIPEDIEHTKYEEENPSDTRRESDESSSTCATGEGDDCIAYESKSSSASISPVNTLALA